ncbi:DUF1799 domain-containing protein [Pseudomonas sp. HD6421]|nr:DUF1799 domain-containing protein [Pseudomonas sp. HD6422]MCT8183619.1 DUF1799 domain-containing protein [Pseudomonas sp. HD6421]
MTLDDIEVEEVEVWPDAWLGFCLFEALGTQWRLGPGGPSGLDYAAIPAVARMMDIKRSQLADVFPDIRIMEREALAIMAEAAE